MAKRKEGVLENILFYAKKEFLEKGFINASLRTIAQEAGTSTGSIYTRFGDKQGLYREIVQPVVDEMIRRFTEIQIMFHNTKADEQEKELQGYTSSKSIDLLAYMYENFEEFQLLLDTSYSTIYENFVGQLVDIELEYTYIYMNTADMTVKENSKISKDIIRIVVTGYMDAMFEVIRHKMSFEDAKTYVNMLNLYHYAGFTTLLEHKK